MSHPPQIATTLFNAWAPVVDQRADTLGGPNLLPGNNVSYAAFLSGTFELWSQTTFTAWEVHFANDILLALLEDTGAMVQQLDLLPESLAAGIGQGNNNLIAFLADAFLDVWEFRFGNLHPILLNIRDSLSEGFGESIGGVSEIIGVTADRQLLATAKHIEVSERTGRTTNQILNSGIGAIFETLQDLGGQPMAEWIESVTPKSPIKPTNKVTTVEYLTTWLALPRTVFKEIYSVLGSVIGAGVELASLSADLLIPAFDPLSTPVINRLENRIRNLGQVTPDRVFDVANDFVKEAYASGMKASLVSNFLEKAGDQVKPLGFNQVAALIGDMSGFQQIIGALWGESLNSALGRPADQLINSITRTKMPSAGELMSAAVERKVTLEDMRQVLQYEGYSDRWIAMMEKAMWQDPRLREIIMLATDVSVDVDDVGRWLSEAGYDDTDISRMTPIIVAQSIKPQRQSFTTEIMANLREGYMDEDEARLHLARMRYTPEATELILDTAALAQRRELVAAHIAVVENAFNSEQITIDELRLSLLALGVVDQRADAIVAKAETKARGRMAREEDRQVDKQIRDIQRVTLAALKAEYQARQIDEAVFLNALVALAFSPDVAREIVALERAKLRAKISSKDTAQAAKLSEQIRNARIQTYLEYFRDKLIDENGLRAALFALGMDSTLAEALVQREIIRAYKPPKGATVPNPPRPVDVRNPVS